MIAYYVQPGDTLSSIAQQFEVTVTAIQAQNGLTDDLITAGQLLMIPVGTGSIPPANTFPYVVQSGDSLFFIARRFNIPFESVLALNPLPNPNLIYPGQVIYLPLATMNGAVAAACPEGTSPYVIQAGDTLASIAVRFGIGIQVILQYNPHITNADVINAGDTLCLPQSNNCPEGSFAYIVKAGDSISKIANEFQIGIEQLTEMNPALVSGNLIVGQLLCIPEFPVNNCPAGQFSYIIQPGDTVYQLSRMFGVSVEAIVLANPRINPDLIYVGETLCIPGKEGCPTGSFGYVVQPGDSLFRLAQRFETTVRAIENINPGLDPLRLTTGQTVCIPEEIPSFICPVGSAPYITQQGDTLASLAVRQNVRPEEIELINPDVDFARLEPGESLCLPLMRFEAPSPTSAEETNANMAAATPNTQQSSEEIPGEVFAIAIDTPAHEITSEEVSAEDEISVTLPDYPETMSEVFTETDDIVSAKTSEIAEDVVDLDAVDAVYAKLEEISESDDQILEAPSGEDLPEMIREEDLFTEARGDEINLEIDDTEVGPPRAPSFRTDETEKKMAEHCQEIQDEAAPLQVRYSSAPAFAYTIQSGDTFANLASRFQTTVAAIQALNPTFNPVNLPVGETLSIPDTQNMTRYVVLIGDSLYLIARRFGLTIEQILAANPQISDPNRIFAGQILWIPI